MNMIDVNCALIQGDDFTCARHPLDPRTGEKSIKKREETKLIYDVKRAMLRQEALGVLRGVRKTYA